MTAVTTCSYGVWGPRPPKPALRLWGRYCVQWLWGPPIWLLARLPLLLLTVLEVEVPQSGRGRMRKPRWRRRIWIDRERLRLERITEPQTQERELRQLLSDHSLTCVPPRPGAAPPLPCSGGQHRLGIDDSYYRLLGARRAFDIAHNECGWVLAENAELSLPGWLAGATLPRRMDEAMTGAPHSFQVSARNPVPALDPLPAHLPTDAVTAWMIRGPSARPEDAPLARVYEPRTTQHFGPRTPGPFWIHVGPDGGPWCSVRPTTADTYDVHADDGALLARITRRAARIAPWPRRARWSAELTSPPQSVTGKAGTWYAWLTYVMTAPCWLLLALCAMAYSFFDGTADDCTLRGPARTRWRTPVAGTVLDYRGISKTYRLAPQHLDVRVAYTLAVLRTRGLGR